MIGGDRAARGRLQDDTLFPTSYVTEDLEVEDIFRELAAESIVPVDDPF